MIAYFDSSALVKRYITEPDSTEVEALIERAEEAGTSLVSRAEVSAAIAKATRMNWIGRTEATRALHIFRDQWFTLVGVEVTEAVVAMADTLAWDHNLRGYDAVHLASALIWQESLGEIVTLATFDRDLWFAGQAVGLTVWPATGK